MQGRSKSFFRVIYQEMKCEKRRNLEGEWVGVQEFFSSATVLQL